VSAEMTREAPRAAAFNFARIDARSCATGQLRTTTPPWRRGRYSPRWPLRVRRGEHYCRPTCQSDCNDDGFAEGGPKLTEHSLIIVDFCNWSRTREELDGVIELKRMLRAQGHGEAAQGRRDRALPDQLKEVEDLKDARRLKDLQGSSGMRKQPTSSASCFGRVYDRRGLGILEAYFAKARETAPFVVGLRWDGPTMT